MVINGGLLPCSKSGFLVPRYLHWQWFGKWCKIIVNLFITVFLRLQVFTRSFKKKNVFFFQTYFFSVINVFLFLSWFLVSSRTYFFLHLLCRAFFVSLSFLCLAIVSCVLQSLSIISSCVLQSLSPIYSCAGVLPFLLSYLPVSCCFFLSSLLVSCYIFLFPDLFSFPYLQTYFSFPEFFGSCILKYISRFSSCVLPSLYSFSFLTSPLFVSCGIFLYSTSNFSLLFSHSFPSWFSFSLSFPFFSLSQDLPTCAPSPHLC